MHIQRCPECGGRLNTNYCDICMRKVPFAGMKSAKRQDPWDSRDGSSAHRREKQHECISFDYEKKPKKTSFVKPSKTTAPNKKGAAMVAIILAVMSLASALFGLVEEAIDSIAVREPEYSISEGFVEAGEPGAENVPNVIAGEIYNANGIRITADYAGINYGEYAVWFTIYNDTNRKISVDLESISVNDYILPFGAYQEVKAGKSEQLSVSFYQEELEKIGINQVAEIAFELYAYESNSYDEIVSKELITVKTEYDGSMETVEAPDGLELYNDGSVKIILTDVNLPGYDDCELTLYAENLSANTADIYHDQIWINGQEAQSYYWKALRPGTRAVDDVYIYELEEMNIEQLSQLEEITMALKVEYMDGWEVLESHSEAVTFDPNAIT